MRIQTILALIVGPWSIAAFDEPWLQYPDDADTYTTNGVEDDGWIHYYKPNDPINDGYAKTNEVIKLKPVCETSEASPWVKDVQKAVEPIMGRENGACSMNNGALAGSHCTGLVHKHSGKISICTHDSTTKNIPCKLVVMMTNWLVEECKNYQSYDEEVVGGYVEWDYMNASGYWARGEHSGDKGFSWVVVST